MAAQIAHDAVKAARSVGEVLPIDDSVNYSEVIPVGNDQPTILRSNHIVSDSSEITSGHNQGIRAADPSSSTVGSVAYAEQLLKGVDYERDLQTLDGLGNDASGSSDTDVKNLDGPGLAQEGEKGHARRNSVKRPAAFKAVSVSKDFLARATSAPSSNRNGETVSAAGQPNAAMSVNAKPRLVAKTTLGNSSTRRLLASAQDGPDPSKVWNKNQPSLPSAPRQFTDEELKQQYGIHMATRLQADGEGKESKWADIDDDDDDWAPETVEWVDGTKSNVAAPSPAPAPPAAIAKIAEAEPRVMPLRADISGPVKPSMPTLAKPSAAISLTSKTILKPGALAASQQGHKTSASIVKSPSEKPALVAKAPAPPPSKSPWAILPPVDKVSPVFPHPPMHPLSHSQPQQTSRRDIFGTESANVRSTREIAADTFDRSWQPDERGNRELYNSRSGRYEAVDDTRRSSIKEDGMPRQPAVLIRPERMTPAEPLTAFQIARASASNSLELNHRRLSNASTSDMRRLSSQNATEDSSKVLDPKMFADTESPSIVHAAASNVEAAVRNPQAEPEPSSEGLPQVSMEDQVAAQKRYIIESRERARQAKREQIEKEQQEEAAKKERLRLKMEKLANASVPTPVDEEPHPARSLAAPVNVERAQSQDTQTTSASERSPQNMLGTASHHGTITMQHAQAPMGKALAEANMKEEQTFAAVVDQENPSAARDAVSSLAPVDVSEERQKTASGSKSSNPWTIVAPESTSSHYSWKANQSDTSSNVWGPLQSKERGLGNGTFNNSSFAGVGPPVNSTFVHPNTNPALVFHTTENRHYERSAKTGDSIDSHVSPPLTLSPPPVSHAAHLTPNAPTGPRQLYFTHDRDHLPSRTGQDFPSHHDLLKGATVSLPLMTKDRDSMPRNTRNAASSVPSYGTGPGGEIGGGQGAQIPFYSDLQRQHAHRMEQHTNQSTLALGKPVSEQPWREERHFDEHKHRVAKLSDFSATVTEARSLPSAIEQPQVQLPGRPAIVQNTPTGRNESTRSARQNMDTVIPTFDTPVVLDQAHLTSIPPSLANVQRGQSSYSANMSSLRNRSPPSSRGPLSQIQSRQSTMNQTRATGWQTFAIQEPLRDQARLEAYKAANMGSLPSTVPANTSVRVDSARSNDHFGKAPSMSLTSSQLSHTSTQRHKPSRFFPLNAELMRCYQPEKGQRSPSDSNNLFEDGTLIRVHLPPPKAKVKLPATAAPKTDLTTSNVINSALRSKQDANLFGMRRRLEGLIDHEPNKLNGTARMDELMATKGEFLWDLMAPSIVLPTHGKESPPDLSIVSTSKPLTHDLFDDRTFASLPGVRVPKSANASLPLRSQTILQTIPTLPIESATGLPYEFPLERMEGLIIIPIRLSGSGSISTVRVPKGSLQDQRSQGPRGRHIEATNRSSQRQALSGVGISPSNRSPIAMSHRKRLGLGSHVDRHGGGGAKRLPSSISRATLS